MLLLIAIENQMPLEGRVHSKRTQSLEFRMPVTPRPSHRGMNGQQPKRFSQVFQVAAGDFFVGMADIPPGLMLEVAGERFALLERQSHFFRSSRTILSRMPVIFS